MQVTRLSAHPNQSRRAGPMSYAWQMRVSAKADYAVRAAVELAAAESLPVKGEAIAQAQEIPLKFLENILGELPTLIDELTTDPAVWAGH